MAPRVSHCEVSTARAALWRLAGPHWLLPLLAAVAAVAAIKTARADVTVALDTGADALQGCGSLSCVLGDPDLACCCCRNEGARTCLWHTTICTPYAHYHMHTTGVPAHATVCHGTLCVQSTTSRSLWRPWSRWWRASSCRALGGAAGSGMPRAPQRATTRRCRLLTSRAPQLCTRFCRPSTAQPAARWWAAHSVPAAARGRMRMPRRLPSGCLGGARASAVQAARQHAHSHSDTLFVRAPAAALLLHCCAVWHTLKRAAACLARWAAATQADQRSCSCSRQDFVTVSGGQASRQVAANRGRCKGRAAGLRNCPAPCECGSATRATVAAPHAQQSQGHHCWQPPLAAARASTLSAAIPPRTPPLATAAGNRRGIPVTMLLCDSHSARYRAGMLPPPPAA